MKGNRIFLWAIGGVAAFGIAAAASASDIGETVKSACSACHSTKRICMNLGQKDQDAWKSNLHAMVSMGAKLPKERIEEAATYLSTLEPGTGLVCE